MRRGRLVQWIGILVFKLFFRRTEGLYANITYVQSAVAKGAVCLDGSPPAYHFDKGFGVGINNWLVHIEGGGWCSDVSSCLARKNTRLGSSKVMVKQLAFSGILSNRHMYNPDFYNWNKVKIGYCDGSSFTGDVEAVNPALLSGCSAGGLTSIIHCDSFQALLPMGTKVKCLSDGGFFINAKDVSGSQHIEAYYKNVVTTHGSAKNLPISCTSIMSPHLCFFPQNIAKQIRTPLFILNAAYDSWQVRNILVPSTADPRGLWLKCKSNFTFCSSAQLKTLQEYRLEYIGEMYKLGKSIARGLFVNSCYAHCQTEMQATWLMPNSSSLGGITIAKAVGDWFYDRRAFQKIDCPYPCDKTCHNRVYDPSTL